MGEAIPFSVSRRQQMRPRTLDHRLNAIESRPVHVEERLKILETIHLHHMVDIDKAVG
jgi:hypothetical protein